MNKLYTDAATKGNIGLGGIGILIIAEGHQDQTHLPLAEMSNHQAEFEAAIAGFKRLLALGLTGPVTFYSDSKLVIEALDKSYAKHYGDYVTELVTLTKQFPLVLWQWLPDHKNRGAHMLAQQGLHEAEAAAQ
ncbi:reverse transcriptase-like protein [Lacticaseibacillus camelliae]|uniref:Cell wall enzyme ebsB n=1 Tax=Lacticaseibacillus camelliae DSM 22697 = JCM 13995 TaxID=1423730 RepID=A0A0R2FL78_9LACO|nr:reverse transcriptase-like protein [Lacticaseibacillus camelliae]KRN25468.1 cell wall enzyme ebsB [Lacticaseibacillus camelliae DSM 22697 = JCM 13995]